MGKRTAVCFIINIVLLIGIIFYLAISKINEKKIVTFNMRDTIDTFLSQASNTKFDEEKIKNLTIKFNDSLDKTIKDFSQNNSVIILVSPAVVSGVDDVTSQIQYLISQKMNQQ